MSVTPDRLREIASLVLAWDQACDAAIKKAGGPHKVDWSDHREVGQVSEAHQRVMAAISDLAKPPPPPPPSDVFVMSQRLTSEIGQALEGLEHFMPDESRRKWAKQLATNFYMARVEVQK